MANNDGAGAGSILLAFLVGAVAGAAVALLYAPATGRETREFLGEKAREGRDRAADAAARGRDMLNQSRETLRTARDARCSARFAPHFKPSASCARTAAAARRAAKKKTPFSFEAVGCKKTSHNPSGRPYDASAPSPGRSLHRVALVDCLCAGIEICGACQTARGGARCGQARFHCREGSDGPRYLLRRALFSEFTAPRRLRQVHRAAAAQRSIEQEGISRHVHRLEQRIGAVHEGVYSGRRCRRAEVEDHREPAVRSVRGRREANRVRRRLEETEDERAGLHEGVCDRRRQVQPEPGGIARAAEKDELRCGLELGAEVNALLVRPERLTSQKALREHVLRRWWR